MSRIARAFRSDLYQTWTGVVVLLCLLAALLSSLIVAVRVEHHFTRLSGYLYQRCLGRERYDDAQTLARKAEIADLNDRIDQERTNKFIDADLRAARIASAERTKTALTAAVALQPASGCSPYKP